jgi:hypothetical protein
VTEGPEDVRFEAALRSLAEVHGEAVIYQATAAAAERALADGSRVGDEVRRANRRGALDRPADLDCAALEAIVARLRDQLSLVAQLPEAKALTSSLARGADREAARLALMLFAGTEALDPAPPYGYRAVSIRSRRRGGETLVEPGELAKTLAALSFEGLEPAGTSAPEEETVGLPSPLVLSPAAASCDSELSLRIDLRRPAVPVLRSGCTGDLWLFTRKRLVAREVVAQDSPQDEWWTASPLPYSAYLERLDVALATSGLTLVREAEVRDPDPRY